mgnify:CR=1
MNIIYDNRKFNFKLFRMFKNHTLLLNSILIVMISVFNSIIDVYGNERLKNRMNMK